MNKLPLSQRSIVLRSMTFKNVRRVLLTLAILATAIALFYTEENWRGKRDWENLKKESAKRGVVLDWEAFIPPPVPDDQNFFKAPNMQKWFVGRGTNEFSQRISYAKLNDFLAERESVPSIVLMVAPSQTVVSSNEADLVLHYKDHVLSSENPDLSGVHKSAPGEAHRHLKISSDALTEIYALVDPKIESFDQTNFTPLVSNIAFQPIGLKPMPHIPPLRIVIKADGNISTNEMMDFLPGRVANPESIVFTSSNSYRAQIIHSMSWSMPMASAAEFLAWSDQFQNDFDAIGAALERPYARMDGEYGMRAFMPIPSFITVRLTAQLLAIRAQSYLLLGKPEKALHEATLLHHLSRLLEARPTGQPMSLVCAMINVAITGIYTQIIGDGLRLNAWREPQLVELQQQLAETDLPPYIYGAFHMEALNGGALTEHKTSKELADLIVDYEHKKTFIQKLRDPQYRFFRFAPHGWIYQGSITSANLELPLLQTLDPEKQLFFPKNSDAQVRRVEECFRHASPYNYFAAILVPNFFHATISVAAIQTLVNQGYVACALERYRFANGHYPETLDALVPQFAEKLPHDVIGGKPLKYRREGDKFVLYSIGWNEKDDGGIPCRTSSPQNFTTNDWVWPYQSPVEK